MWVVLMVASMVVPEGGLIVVMWLVHRRLQRFSTQSVQSLATELVGHCMYCGRKVRDRIGYCDVVCRHGYERRTISPH